MPQEDSIHVHPEDILNLSAERLRATLGKSTSTASCLSVIDGLRQVATISFDAAMADNSIDRHDYVMRWTAVMLMLSAERSKRMAPWPGAAC